MVTYIEIRKIEKDFGNDRWAIRIGDIAGSTNHHNISKADLIKIVIDEIEEESQTESDDEVKNKVISELFETFIGDSEAMIQKKYNSGQVNSALYNFKKELEKKLLTKKWDEKMFMTINGKTHFFIIKRIPNRRRNKFKMIIEKKGYWKVKTKNGIQTKRRRGNQNSSRRWE